jgi:orotate phosphoribosyltransferase
VLVEDVLTTGGQVLEAQVIGAAGAKIDRIIGVIDRQEGARQAIESAGYKFESLFTTDDLGIKK